MHTKEIYKLLEKHHRQVIKDKAEQARLEQRSKTLNVGISVINSYLNFNTISFMYSALHDKKR